MHPSRYVNAAFSLIELLLVLAIISLIVMMSTRFFGTVSDSQKISQALTDIKAIRQAAAEWAMGQGDYTNISMTVLNNAGLLPSSIGNGVGKTPWKSNYFIAPGASPSELLIALTGKTQTTVAIPTTDCTNLKNLLQNQALSINVNCANALIFSATFG